MKKLVWALVSIEVEGDDLDDDGAMDWVLEDLQPQGYVIDDIGVRKRAYRSLEEDKA